MGLFSSGAGKIRRAEQTAANYLMQGRNEAQGVMSDALGQATGNLNANRPIFDTAYNTAKDAISNGYGSALARLSGQNDYLQPFYQTGTQANSGYADAMGFNGAEGSSRASQAFRSAPGYAETLSQATDQSMRNAAAMGGLASGNTVSAISSNAANLADKGWQGYLGNLQRGVNTGLTAAQGMGQNDQGMASLYVNQGNALADLAQNYGTQQAGINTGLAGLNSAHGDNLANLISGTYNQLGNNAISSASAQAQANANRTNSIIGAATGAAGLFRK